MMTLVVIGISLGSVCGLVALASLILIARRDRLKLPSARWNPIPDLPLLECKVGAETVRYWELKGLAQSAQKQNATLVFFHGIGAWSYVWRDLVPLLSQNFRLILVDLPGFGLSSKVPESRYNLDEQVVTVAGFLEKVGGKNQILVGSSMGGAIALWLAKLHPDRYRGIVVISPAINGTRYWLPIFIPLALVRTLAFIANRFLFRLIMRNVIESHSRITDEMINEYWRPFASDPESAVTFVKGLRVIDDPRLPYQLEGLSEQIPICVLWGSKDHMTPVRDHKLLSRYLPRAEFYSHPSSGHHVMEDAPEWCALQIQSFLTSHGLN